jgi:hypothetical protein
VIHIHERDQHTFLCNLFHLDYPGKTLRDKIRSDQLRQLSGIQNIIKWADVRRKEWDGHVERMEDNRLAKIARDNRPQGVRS